MPQKNQKLLDNLAELTEKDAEEIREEIEKRRLTLNNSDRKKVAMENRLAVQQQTDEKAIQAAYEKLQKQ